VVARLRVVYSRRLFPFAVVAPAIVSGQFAGSGHSVPSVQSASSPDFYAAGCFFPDIDHFLVYAVN